jgi:hypothetical protein
MANKNFALMKPHLSLGQAPAAVVAIMVCAFFF